MNIAISINDIVIVRCQWNVKHGRQNIFKGYLLHCAFIGVSRLYPLRSLEMNYGLGLKTIEHLYGIMDLY